MAKKTDAQKIPAAGWRVWKDFDRQWRWAVSCRDGDDGGPTKGICPTREGAESQAQFAAARLMTNAAARKAAEWHYMDDDGRPVGWPK